MSSPYPFDHLQSSRSGFEIAIQSIDKIKSTICFQYNRNWIIFSKLISIVLCLSNHTDHKFRHFISVHSLRRSATATAYSVEMRANHCSTVTGWEYIASALCENFSVLNAAESREQLRAFRHTKEQRLFGFFFEVDVLKIVFMLSTMYLSTSIPIFIANFV